MSARTCSAGLPHLERVSIRRLRCRRLADRAGGLHVRGSEYSLWQLEPCFLQARAAYTSCTKPHVEAERSAVCVLWVLPMASRLSPPERQPLSASAGVLSPPLVAERITFAIH